ncbi:hypothetical protein AVEN_199649-1 [Araneus ventricosus]|uniref:Uncharacterized protein n=1 Tax=Araneus ventricosus TaxID=182803 RepID=A0A4Y2DF10_ARAVE|nr:hypothetical protein AVEN_199649-1 [Araneus ventricosus]
MNYPKMKLKCGHAQDLFQCDHFSRGPHIQSCTQHSPWSKVTCHKECSAQPVIYFPLRSSTSGLHQDRPGTSNNPTGKSRMRLDSGRMGMENVLYTKLANELIVTFWNFSFA